MEIKLKCSDYKLKVDIQSFLKDLLSSKFDPIKIINIKQSKAGKAFMLFLKSTNKTNLELSIKYAQKEIAETDDVVANYNFLEHEIKKFLEQEIVVTKDFFENIIQYSSSYLNQSFLLFKKYMFFLKANVSEEIEYEYYLLYRKNLEEEYQNGKENYKELYEFFNNPITKENKKFDSLLDHYKKIKSFYTQPLQNNLENRQETLQDLYIEPYFEIYESNINKKKYNTEKKFYKKLFYYPNDNKINIHQFFDDYFLKGSCFPYCKEAYNMLFVLGQPGQGKTSLCYKFAYDILSKGIPDKPIFFIKIRDLCAKDFVEKPFETINSYLNQDIVFNQDECLLILDGLDEAYMSGGLKEYDLKNLVDRLNKICQQNKRLKVVLTSRINYLNINDSSLDGCLILHLDELTDIQIIEYINRFKNFYPDNNLVKSIKLILKDKKFDHIKELLKQAVLMYFIAVSNVEINEKDSKSIIYDKIFDTLTQRSWDNNKQLYYVKEDLRQDSKKFSLYLRIYIRNIAFAIYQSPKLHITLQELYDLDATKLFITKCFNEDLGQNQNEINNISKYLLISFYFQPSKKEENSAIEFFHNSLWEYLTAEYIWEENKNFLTKKDEQGDLILIKKENYFQLLDTLIGDKEISIEIINNVKDIIRNSNYEIKKLLFGRIENLFYELEKIDFLMFYSWKKEGFTSIEKTYEIFKLIWLILHELNLCNKKLINFSSSYWMFRNDNYINSFGNLENINFNKNIDKVYFVGCYVKNIIINQHILKKYENTIYEDGYIVINSFPSTRYFCRGNKFAYMKIYCSRLDGNILHNKFENVTFENIIIDKTFLFEDNSLINSFFINVKIPDKRWLSKIINSNDVDKSFRENHHVTFDETEKAYFINRSKNLKLPFFD